jgi:uncharacterized protein (TIGR01777 family)
MKTIGITGGSGFVGSHLTVLLVSKRYEVVIFSRDTAKDPGKMVTYAHWDAERGECDVNALKKVDAVVNLAGAGIADERWSEKRKREIVNSRVKGTNFLVSQLKQYAPGCKTFVAASAMGYYGPDSEDAIPFTETSPPGEDFLGDTCRQWEGASQKASEFARTVILRFGIVLGKESGAFPKFAKPMSFGIAPVLGSGKQVMSWIEINDLARLILFALEHEEISGVYNAVSPNPVTCRELMKTIALVKGGIKIPVTIPVFLLKIALGEMSSEVLKSCTVSAQKILSTGFIFDHPGIQGAVKAILTK